ncbi:MAG TPA: RagB/SusD family nutrient uptake outer membrane protein [Prevotella sp.]|nr:RagB/SusD family nutrient uptake outer membrane protein [Prevotella sp.]
MNILYKFGCVILAATALTACDDYLDVVPKGDIETVESNFEQKEGAYKWLKTCYSMIKDETGDFLESPGYFGSDEFVSGQYLRNFGVSYTDHFWGCGFFISDGLQMASNPYNNVWAKDKFYCGINYCNIFLEHMDACGNATDDEKMVWKAEVKAIKAQYYFELLRRYGPFILVPKNIPVNSSISMMQQPRQPIDSCVNAIVKLCDEAIKDLPSRQTALSTNKAYYNKEAAATLKAYALLYAASPLFNGNLAMKSFKNKDGVRLFPDYDKEKWHKAAVAADEAIKYCEEGGEKLYSGTVDQATPLLNTIMDIRMSSFDFRHESNEALLSFEDIYGTCNGFTYRVPLIPESYKNGNYYDHSAKGCVGASMKMVEMFYTDNGLPIDEDKSWLSAPYTMSKEADSKYRNVVPINSDVLTLHRRREPRFYADIAAHGTYWVQPVSKSGKKQYEALLVDMRQGQPFGTQANTINSNTPQCLSGYWVKKGINPTQPFREYVDGESNAGEKQVVYRLPELYLMSGEAWNEYLDKPNQHVYDMIDVVRKRAGIPDVVTSWTSYAKHPDKVKTTDGMREIIHREWNIEFAFEGRRFWNLRRWMEAETTLNEPQRGWNILGKSDQAFYNNYQGPIVVWKKRKFDARRDYFWPIRAEEILVSGVKQNPGW